MNNQLVTFSMQKKYRVVQKKIARSLMQRHFFATVCGRITRFSPKCSEKIIIYQSMVNLYQLVKYSLINSRNLILAMSDITMHAKMTALTVEDRLLIKNSQTEEAGLLKKNDSRLSTETVKIAYAV